MTRKKTMKIISVIIAGLVFTSLIPVSVNAVSITSKNPNSVSKLQGPGPAKPLDIQVLDNFTKENGWTISGADVKYTSNGAVFTLTSNVATITKRFSYPTWEYSDLYVKVNEVSEGATWALDVKATHSNSKTMKIQNDSPNANSKYGEHFIYSLEGLAGSEAQSDWNDENLTSKEFDILFTLKGEEGKNVTLGELSRVKPNYDIPIALPSTVKGQYGGLNFNGDPNFDVETIKNDDPDNSTSQLLNEHMWLSLPYSRLVLNPTFEFDNGKITAVDPDLDLKFGAYYGIKGNANKTNINGSYIVESKSGFQNSSLNSILTVDGVRLDSKTITSAWYPHKLERGGNFPGKGDISLFDFMIDTNTIGRIIDSSAITGDKFEITVKDSTKVSSDKYNANNLICSWDSNNNVVIKTDALYNDWNQNLFYTAMKVVALNEDGSVNEDLTKTIETPIFTNGVGKYSIPSSINKVGLVIGYANREEGVNKAITRANDAINNNIVNGYNNTKKYWNDTLKKAPVPTIWGVEDKNIKDYETVTPEKHRILYYSGWVYNLINILPTTPETGYAFTQQALGKASRQVGGASMTPANNCWEGVLQIQNIMYLDPSASWSAMEGFMAMVDANGYLDGEVLPVRMAQTLWMVHSVSPDKARLQAMYPALKRHLEYKISDPRWIYGNEKTENEIDQEYITSWLNDVTYMIEICKELGGEYSNDIAYWEVEYDKALANYVDWFFANPLSHEAVGSFPQDGTAPKDSEGKIQLRNGAGLPKANYQRGIWTRIFHKDGDVNYFKDTCTNNKNEYDDSEYVHSNKGGHVITPNPGRYPREWIQVILSGLVVNDIPAKEAQQLEQLFLDINNPALPLSGLENLKWAPNSLLIYGLINKGYYSEAKNQLDSYLVKSIDVWEFCENYFYNQSGPKGTSPTSFGASQIIEVTMLKNGVINDGSGVKEIANWDTNGNERINPEVNAFIESDLDLNTVNSILPTEITQFYNREDANNVDFTVNKVTTVKWDLNTVTPITGTNNFTILGTTETYDKINATIVTNADKTYLEVLVNDAKELLKNSEVGNNPGQYPESAVKSLKDSISAAEAVLTSETTTTEEIGQAILALQKAIAEFKNSIIPDNEEDTSEPSPPTNDINDGSNNNSGDTTPSTGDNSIKYILLFSSLGVAALLLLIKSKNIANN